MQSSQGKMQIRIDVVSLLNKYRNALNLSADTINNDLKFLREIKDKELLAKLLFGELLKNDESSKYICAFFIMDIFSDEIILNNIKKALIDTNIDDEVKLFLYSILKQKEIPIPEDDNANYTDSLSKIAKANITNYLHNLSYDPEIQIDFLDFYTTVGAYERGYILDCLVNDCAEDDILSIFSLIVNLELSSQELDFILEYIKDKVSFKVVNILEKIKLNFPDYKKTDFNFDKQIKKIKFLCKTESDEVLIISSKPYKCNIGYIDGKNEFSLVFSRKNLNSKYTAILFVINTKNGITASVGFDNIVKDSYETIIERVYCTYPPIEISPVATKTIYEYFKNKNISTNTKIPYESFVWEKFMSDVRVVNFDIKEFLKSKTNLVEITKENFDKLLNSDILSRWFYIYKQDKYFDNLIDKIESSDDLSIDSIDKILIKSIAKRVFEDKEYISNLKENILLQSYIANLAKRKISSGVLQSILLSDKYMTKLILNIFKRSVYQYYLLRKLDIEFKNKKSVFKVSKCARLNLEQIDKLINEIEDKWKLGNE